jgi:ribosome-associated protein
MIMDFIGQINPMSTDPVLDLQSRNLLRNLVTALGDKKAENLLVLNVGGISNITDYLVLATGNSEPHLRALRIEAEKVLDAAKTPIAGMDQGGFGSGWTVVDAYQIMLHVFTAEQRKNYALEKLWKDATELDLITLTAKAATSTKLDKPKPHAKSTLKPKVAPTVKAAKIAVKKVAPKKQPLLTTPKTEPTVPKIKPAGKKSAAKQPVAGLEQVKPAKVKTAKTTTKKTSV